VIVLEFSFAMRTEVHITKKLSGRTPTLRFGRRGIQRAIAELVNKNDPKVQANEGKT